MTQELSCKYQDSVYVYIKTTPTVEVNVTPANIEPGQNVTFRLVMNYKVFYYLITLYLEPPRRPQQDAL